MTHVNGTCVSASDTVSVLRPSNNTLNDPCATLQPSAKDGYFVAQMPPVVTSKVMYVRGEILDGGAASTDSISGFHILAHTWYQVLFVGIFSFFVFDMAGDVRSRSVGGCVKWDTASSCSTSALHVAYTVRSHNTTVGHVK